MSSYSEWLNVYVQYPHSVPFLMIPSHLVHYALLITLAKCIFTLFCHSFCIQLSTFNRQSTGIWLYGLGISSLHSKYNNVHFCQNLSEKILFSRENAFETHFDFQNLKLHSRNFWEKYPLVISIILIGTHRKFKIVNFNDYH